MSLWLMRERKKTQNGTQHTKKHRTFAVQYRQEEHPWHTIFGLDDAKA